MGESGGSAVVLVLVVSDDASVNNSVSDVAGEGGGGVDLRSRWALPILFLVKERTRMVASSEVIDRGLVWVLRELGLKVEEEEERFGRKMEKEKNERNDGGSVVVNVAIFTQGERERERERERELSFYFFFN